MSDSLGGIFSGFVGAYLVYGSHGIGAGDIGFALNQILVFSNLLLYLARSVGFRFTYHGYDLPYAVEHTTCLRFRRIGMAAQDA